MRYISVSIHGITMADAKTKNSQVIGTLRPLKPAIQTYVIIRIT